MKLSLRKTSCYALCILLFSACEKDKEKATDPPFTYPLKATIKTPAVIFTTNNGTKVYGSGYGSAMVQVPGEPGSFFLMTDRGPNADGSVSDSKIFPLPEFNPHIAKFRIEGDSLVYLSSIEFKSASGTKITGRPNPVGSGNTGEMALDFSGNTVANDPEGLDSEGLAIATDGTFWLSDEYGPHLVHLDKTGKTIERINPYGTGTGGRKIPDVFMRRRPNRGMEGLTITPDGKSLVGLMQSPLYNPGKSAVVNSRITRILVYDIANGLTKQYAYILENKKNVNSEIVAITNNTFIVLERDQDFPNAPASPSTFKQVYKIDISNATELSDPSNSPSGLLFGGKTLEELTDTEISSYSIKGVTKELIVDLLTISGGYAHDKAEGLAIINDNMIAVSNDDDFGMASPTPANNTIVPKILPATNDVDRNVIYFIPLAKSLR